MIILQYLRVSARNPNLYGHSKSLDYAIVWISISWQVLVYRINAVTKWSKVKYCILKLKQTYEKVVNSEVDKIWNPGGGGRGGLGYSLMIKTCIHIFIHFTVWDEHIMTAVSRFLLMQFRLFVCTPSGGLNTSVFTSRRFLFLKRRLVLLGHVYLP